MKLLPDEIARDLPPIGSTEGQDDLALCRVKFFLPFSSWVWYVIEYDPDDRNCFGFVRGFEDERGYFSLDELESVRDHRFALPIERDVAFEPTSLGEIRRQVHPVTNPRAQPRSADVDP